MADLTTLNDQNFEQHLAESDKPVLVDFWAEWCGPCRMVAPVLEEISRERGEDLAIAKLNVDEAPQTAMRFEVMSIPTLILFHKGEAKLRIVGAKGKAQLMSEIEPHLTTTA